MGLYLYEHTVQRVIERNKRTLSRIDGWSGTGGKSVEVESRLLWTGH